MGNRLRAELMRMRLHNFHFSFVSRVYARPSIPAV